MNAHILIAHPEPKSLNHSLARSSQNIMEQQGFKTTISDLYGMGFDPAERADHYSQRSNDTHFFAQTEQRHGAETDTLPVQIQSEIDHLMASDLLVIHFPLWWFGPPAMLKGWMDRVFVYGQMYTSQRRYDRGACHGKHLIACVTDGAGEDSCAYNGREGDITLHLWPVLFPFRYLGFDIINPAVFYGVGGVASIEGEGAADNQATGIINSWENILASRDGRELWHYNSDDDFDETKRLKATAPSFSPFVRHEP